MKRYHKIFGLSFLLAILAIQSGNGQQLPQFSQYIFNGLHINPGYAGYKNQGYIQSTYRNQWVNLDGAPRTFTITADLSANEGMMGFGVSVLSDQIGPTRTTTGLLTYSYRIQTGKESFSIFTPNKVCTRANKPSRTFGKGKYCLTSFSENA